MGDLNYIVVNNKNEMQFEIKLDGEKAFLTYRFHNNDIALMHTFVPTEFSGKGIASGLVKAAFKYAEEHNKMVIVYCPFIINFLKTYPEYNNQVHK